MSASYQEFLLRKSQGACGSGFDPIHLPEGLFPFQRFLTAWAIRQGRGAIFADCGMGKTFMELVWCDNVHRHTGRPVLLVCPIAVGFQMVQEAQKFGIEASVSRTGAVAGPITITNYEQLSKFNPDDFSGVALDESSAIKNFEGTTRALVTELMRTRPYRLLCTATAAPNDYTELGTSSEALGELGYIEMLNRFFVNDNNTSDTKGKWRATPRREYSSQGWRFKGHAVDAFWRWVGSWARAIRKPSDYGFDDTGYDLPAMQERLHTVQATQARQGQLFDVAAVGLAEEREALRRSLSERCELAASLATHDEPVVVWCNLNDEAKRLTRAIPGAVEVSGSDSLESKEEKLQAFSSGQVRCLVTKPAIGAWGLNWQHCRRVVYFPTHSYEQYYQAVRRCWRFGQSREVVVDMVTADSCAHVVENLKGKSARADEMFDRLVAYMGDALKIDRGVVYDKGISLPDWL